MSRYACILSNPCICPRTVSDVTDVTNHEQVARALLEAKADIEAVSNRGGTALMLSAQNGHEQVCAQCLGRQTDSN